MKLALLLYLVYTREVEGKKASAVRDGGDSPLRIHFHFDMHPRGHPNKSLFAHERGCCEAVIRKAHTLSVVATDLLQNGSAVCWCLNEKAMSSRSL